MTDKKIADPETAIAFLEMESKMSSPTPQSIRESGRMKMPDITKQLLKDPKSATDIAHSVIDELRSGKLKA